jgi:hypothetical protein
VVPREFFAFCIYSAALDAYTSHERLDGRISAAAVINTLSRAGMAAGGAGGRPPVFCIAERHVTALLADTDEPAGSSVASCNIDNALSMLANARSSIVQTPQLRRFLSFVPSLWPTVVADARVVNEFRDGRRSSILWSGPSLTYLRRKLESLASLMGVCMSHTNSSVARTSGGCTDIYRCHRRQQPKVWRQYGSAVCLIHAPCLLFFVSCVASQTRPPRVAAIAAAAVLAPTGVDAADFVDSDSGCSDVESSASDHDISTPAHGAASAADEARVAASAAAHTARAHRRNEITPVGVGCKCSWVLAQCGRTWLLIQRGVHTGHTPGDEESNTHLPLPAEWERAAAAGLVIEDEDPVQAANHYLDILHEARLKRDNIRIYSDQDGEPLPAFGHNIPAQSPEGMFRAKRGAHLNPKNAAFVTAALNVSAESSPPGRGSNAPFVCICRSPREVVVEGPVIYCTQAKFCLQGGVFHLATSDNPDGCVPQSDLDVDNSYTCTSCRRERQEHERVAAALPQEDAVVASNFDDPASNDAEDARSVAGDGASSAAGSALTEPTLRGRQLAAARTSRGLPTHATAFKSWCTPPEFSSLRSARARSKRGGVRISAEYIPFLKE